jgi:hypothetical protein
LSSKLSRDKPRNPSKKASQEKGEEQMLTVSEISDRKKARKSLETKKLALEEAVERSVCEKVYMKLWHHRSAEDEQLDQKLRSRIAALSLVGIGFTELLISGAEDVSEEVRQKTVNQEASIRESLAPARTSIMEMTRENYPLGKLHHLTNAHKSIVETLSNFFPASSSADEILPTLIYTLITSPPEEVNVISDLHFIQRFRASSKIDGEAAYCMVNLEAAISFLETIELSTLRADESSHGPDKHTIASPKKDAAPMDLGIKAVSPMSSKLEPFPAFQPSELSPLVPPKQLQPARSPRRLSELIQAQTNRLEAASDSLRGAVMDSADQAVGALENSLRFLFGRIRESHQPGSEGSPAPKTLEDARKLVSTPPPPAVEDENGNIGSPSGTERPPSDISSTDESAANGARDTLPSTNRVLDLVGGRRPLRDHSVDSNRSGGSGKRVSFAESGGLAPALAMDKDSFGSPSPLSALEPMVPSAPQMASPAPSPLSPLPLAAAGVESMRSLGNTLNPLNQFAKIGLFGRGANTAAAPTSAPTSAPQSQQTVPSGAAIAGQRLTVTEMKSIAAVDELKKSSPGVVRRFMDCRDARELRLGEIEELLAEYKKLALALGKVTSS